MSKTKKKVTLREYSNEEFDEALKEIIDEEPASNLLSIPGVYEVLAEHFNNDVLEHLDQERDNDESYAQSMEEE